MCVIVIRFNDLTWLLIVKFVVLIDKLFEIQRSHFAFFTANN